MRVAQDSGREEVLRAIENSSVLDIGARVSRGELLFKNHSSSLLGNYNALKLLSPGEVEADSLPTFKTQGR